MPEDERRELPHLTLVEGTTSAKIYLRGAALASFITDGIEWLGTRGDAKFDGSKKNISGGVPICWPQFGPGDPLGRDIPNPETAAMPVHGFARNLDWHLVESGASECTLELTETKETLELWPHRFRCRCIVKIADGRLRWALEVRNESSSACRFSCGVHTYFDTPDIDQLSIRGPFAGSSRMNRKQDPPEMIGCDSDTVAIGSFTDDIYKDILPGSMTLFNPDKPPLTIVGGGGWQSVVVWNPHGDEKLGYKSFVCVESVATDPIVLQPSNSWSATLELIPELH